MEYSEKVKALRDEAILRANANFSLLVRALRGQGHIDKIVPRGIVSQIVEIDGVYLPVIFDLERDCSGKPNGKIRLKIGSYGNSKNFPEPKGGFDSDKTLERVLEAYTEAKKRAEASDASDEHRRQRRANLDVVACLMDVDVHDPDEFRLSPGIKVRVNSPEGDPDRVVVEVTLPPLEAAALIRARIAEAEKHYPK